MDAMKKKALEAASILNYLIGDLVGASRSYGVFEDRADRAKAKKSRLVMRRIYISYIVLTLAKISEFYDKYRNIIPADSRKPFKDLKMKIETLRVREFRNVFVGHIHDKSGHPITDEQLENYFQNVTDRDVNKFLEWINTPGTNKFPNTVVSIVETTRDRIFEEYGITP
jgi:hypothetical protein